MSRGEPGESFPSGELSELVDNLDAEIKAILVAYCVGEKEAEEIVYETMMALGLRWDRVQDRKRWFLEALEHACGRDTGGPASETN